MHVFGREGPAPGERLQHEDVVGGHAPRRPAGAIANAARSRRRGDAHVADAAGPSASIARELLVAATATTVLPSRSRSECTGEPRLTISSCPPRRSPARKPRARAAHRCSWSAPHSRSSAPRSDIVDAVLGRDETELDVRPRARDGGCDLIGNRAAEIDRVSRGLAVAAAVGERHRELAVPETHDATVLDALERAASGEAGGSAANEAGGGAHVAAATSRITRPIVPSAMRSIADLRRRLTSRHQNITFASTRPVNTATQVATSPGIMNEWLSTYLPIFVVPDRSKLIAAISEP